MKAVFVDRDGVINRNRRDHVKSWEEFAFLPRAAEALAELTRHGLRIVVLTNQAIVNRGMVPRERVDEIHARMVDALEAAGARIEGVFYCPHRPDERCDCRKPNPGLLLQVSRELGIDISRSYLIGDALSDLRAAWSAGCRPILVMSGRGKRQFLSLLSHRRRGFAVSRDLWHAVRRVLIQEGLVHPGPFELARTRLLWPLASEEGESRAQRLAGTGVSPDSSLIPSPPGRGSG